MKKYFLNSLVIVAITVVAIFSSCNKEDSKDGKGEGLLIVNGQEYLITDCCFGIQKNHDNFVCFKKSGNDCFGHLHVYLKPSDLTTKTYTISDDDIVVVGVLIDETTGYSGSKDFVMKVTISDEIYDFDICGKALVNEENEEYYDYTLKYKGTMRVEKDK